MGNNEQKVRKTNIFAIAAFVASFFSIPVGILLTIIAFVQINESKEKGKGYLIAAIVIMIIKAIIKAILGLLGFVFSLFFWWLF